MAKIIKFEDSISQYVESAHCAIAEVHKLEVALVKYREKSWLQKKECFRSYLEY